MLDARRREKELPPAGGLVSEDATESEMKLWSTGGERDAVGDEATKKADEEEEEEGRKRRRGLLDE